MKRLIFILLSSNNIVIKRSRIHNLEEPYKRTPIPPELSKHRQTNNLHLQVLLVGISGCATNLHPKAQITPKHTPFKNQNRFEDNSFENDPFKNNSFEKRRQTCNLQPFRRETRKAVNTKSSYHTIIADIGPHFCSTEASLKVKETLRLAQVCLGVYSSRATRLLLYNVSHPPNFQAIAYQHNHSSGHRSL
jgi:hypothetical protein